MDSLFAAVEDEFDAGIGMGIGVAHMNEQPTHPSNTPADQFSKGQSSFLSTVPLPLPSTPSVSNQSHLPFQSPFLQQASPMQMPIFNNQFKPYQINPNSNLNPYQFQQPLLQHPQQQALHAQAQQHAMFQYQYQQQQQQQQQLQQMNLSKHYHQPQLQGYQPSISQYQQPQSQINHTLNIPTSSTPNPFVYPKLLNDSVMNDNDGTENNIGSKKRKEDSLKEEPDVSKMNLESMLDVTSYGGVNVNEGTSKTTTTTYSCFSILSFSILSTTLFNFFL